ncbi:hypothetical protein DN069_01965 [Streptacidiphilus pinicola]|uniref:GAF domain-containing protein n=2 Tax=Streptacidiphilus pinicola TaxID=2219663 RepID=A0A2X0IQC9_9ACTN|nr:hypothetical protein DN069_01965 [Streptacidiphilus pinicola]
MEPLQRVTAPYRDGARVPSRPAASARAGGELDAYITLSLEEPAAARSLHEAVSTLPACADLAGLLPQVIESAMTFMDTGFASVQLVDPGHGALVLVAQSGFGPGFLDHFAVVQDGSSVCGQAAREGTQAVVPDVRDESALEPHWDAFRAAGVRAVQSTPLVDGSGRMVGMLSTHTPRPRLPSERDLLVLRLYSRFVGAAVGRLLDGTCHDADGAGTVSTPASGLGTGPAQAASRLGRSMSEAVNRLLSAGMSFAEVQALVDDPLAADRVRTGVEEIDAAIQVIRMAMLEHVAPGSG